MYTEHRVKLFRIGRDQVVEIPSELELAGENVIMRKEGDRLVIEPACVAPGRPAAAD